MLFAHIHGVLPDKVKRSTFFQQFGLLSTRAFLNTIRSPLATFVQFFQSVIMGLLLGSIYWQVKSNQQSIQVCRPSVY
jgi:hypothetical protein